MTKKKQEYVKVYREMVHTKKACVRVLSVEGGLKRSLKCACPGQTKKIPSVSTQAHWVD